MADYDPKDLLALCASILDDGEVTSDEAYQLADWLNNHPDASEKWPGKELIKPLQEIWVDGSVNRRELHRLARLLISIQREWARRPKTEIGHITGGPLPEFSATDIEEARLPNLRGKFRVPSQSEPGRFYEVDLSGPSCTCPDWRTWRSRLPIGDLTRCCKHVLDVYAKLPRDRNGDGWMLAFIENGWPAHPGAEWHLLAVGSDKVLFCTASDKGWANVFAKEDSGYSRFGFNVDENRWAYGTEPRRGPTIARAIASFGNEPARHDRGDEIAPSNNKIPQPRSYSVALWIFAGVMAIIAIAALIERQPILRTRVNEQAIMTSSSRTSTVQPPTTTPAVITKVPTTTPVAQPTMNSLPAKVRTTRAVRAETGRGEILIPNKTELRVLDRAGSDLVVSYKGWTVTIPASAVSSSAR